MMVRRVLVAAAACVAAGVAAVPASASACYHPRPANTVTTQRAVQPPISRAPATSTAPAPVRRTAAAPPRQPAPAPVAATSRAPVQPDPPPRPVAPAPSPAPVTTVSAPAASGDPVEAAFGSQGPAAVAWARRVSACESGGNANARNPSGATGTFQFMPSTWASTPQARAGMSITDPNASAQAAAWMYSQGRQSEWSCN